MHHCFYSNELAPHTLPLPPHHFRRRPELFFRSPDFETSVNRRFLCPAIRDAAGLPKIHLYDLRHTTATLLLSAGENPKVVSESLGHASIVLTLDTYSHVLPTMQETATNKIEKLMLGK